MVHRRLLRLLVSICLLFACAGCREAQDELAALNQAGEYAELPGLRASHHQGLQQELARLTGERATPLLLDQSASAAKTDPAATNTPAAGGGDAPEPVVKWSQFFAPRPIDDVARRVDEIYPPGGLQFPAPALRTAVELRTQYEAQRQRFRRLSAQELPASWHHADGLLADISQISVAQICTRLEGLAAAELLHDGRPDAALDAVRHMLAYAQSMAAEPRVVARVAAVYARHDALRALAAVLDHPRSDAPLLREAAAQVETLLQSWPHDKLAWIGDRAAGLHTYEMVRDGRLLSLLTSEEKVRFRRLGMYDELEESVAANIDADEMYYLSAMRRLIAVCDKPHHQRTALLKAVRHELLDLHSTAQYPLVADTLLLSDFEQGFRLQALDRARVEAWRLALRHALAARDAGSATAEPEQVVNSLTGEPFRVAIGGKHVVVEGVDPQTDERVRVRIAERPQG